MLKLFPLSTKEPSPLRSLMVAFSPFNFWPSQNSSFPFPLSPLLSLLRTSQGLLVHHDAGQSYYLSLPPSVDGMSGYHCHYCH
ncbi:hypothetical protein L873DRAFT_1813075 [Choiromyces venosus 120613-1]|uniref:Uncharacterized protein n=1 Tax=Choiromyces venosus 120613-1 TaxID=1336337 RepID=A0A3N4JAQ5_9PEZI|nr:hypothetical protein L873DRAFT_1813075 [Choiromyces venosus 120613-1]